MRITLTFRGDAPGIAAPVSPVTQPDVRQQPMHKDIQPAQALGIWLCQQQTDCHLNSDLNSQPDNVRVITSLRELSE